MGSSWKKQRGASFYSILLFLIVLGTVVSVGLKLWSPYMDHRAIDTVIRDVSLNPAELAKKPKDLRRDIDKKIGINYVSLPDRDALKISREKGIIYFDLKYEVRVPMFFNVDAVVMFEEHYEATAP
jgi:hypothetical protein